MVKKRNPFKDVNGKPKAGYEKSAKAWDEAQERASSERRRQKLFEYPTENPFIDAAGRARPGYERSAADWQPLGSLASTPLIAGVVYVLTNPALSGLVKIGWTERSVQERVRELQTTGVPAPFRVAFTINHHFASKLEKMVHLKLESRRYHGNREFFKCTVDDAIRTIEDCASKI